MEINIKGEDFGHRPKKERPKPTKPWECRCLAEGNPNGMYQLNPPWRLNCPDCYDVRPY